jgi:hypothetical protein
MPWISRIPRGVGWFAVLLILLPCIVLLALLFIWHLHYQSALATIAAITPRAGVARPSPTPQPALIAAYDALVDDPDRRPVVSEYSSLHRTVPAWIAGGPGPVPAEAATDLAREADRMDHLHDLLAHGLRWGHDLTLAPGTLARYQLPDFMNVFAMAENFRLRARAAEDPRQALSDLTAFQSSLLPPNSLSAYHTALGIAHQREQAFLTAAVLANLPPDLGRDWQDHPLDPFVHLLTGLEMERCFWEPAETAYIANLDPIAYDRQFHFIGDQTFSDSVHYWWSNLGEMQQREQALTEAEDRLLTGAPPMKAWAIPNGEYMMIDGYRSQPRAALREASEHRLAALAAQVIAIQDRTGALPPDGDGLDLAPGANRFQLRYQRLDDHRFSIVIDPLTPRPDYLDAQSFRSFTAPDPIPAGGAYTLSEGQVQVDRAPR